jgi:hypothetical protein
MVQQAKKKHPSSFKPSDTFHKAQETVQEIERDTVENIISGTDDFNRAATEGMDICSDNMSAIVESGNVASRIFQETSNEIMESCNRALSVCTEISREAMVCRTINDLMELQNNAVQQICENYFTTANKLCEMFFDSCGEAMAPIAKRGNNASNQFRKALAA